MIRNAIDSSLFGNIVNNRIHTNKLETFLSVKDANDFLKTASTDQYVTIHNVFSYKDMIVVWYTKEEYI